MKFEFSAGGVVVKPVRLAQGSSRELTPRGKKDYLVLLAQHAAHHGWVFPKGLIGDNIKGEKKEETAVREVEEETGVLATLGKPLTPVTYWYQMDGIKRKKTVYYFLMEYVSEDPSKKDDEMEEVLWLPADEVSEKLTYPSDKKVWEEARKLLN